MANEFAVSDSTSAVPTGTHQSSIQVGKHKLNYLRSGQGPDLMFVHGWPLHAATFRKIVPQLEADYTCHRIDLPCAGETTTDGEQVGFIEQISVLRQAIDALGLKRYAFVGHDSGGLLARYIAADDARVVALVLGDTELPGPPPQSVAMLAGLPRMPLGPELFRAAMRYPAVRHSNFGFRPSLESLAFLSGEFDRLFLEPIFASASATRRTLTALDGYGELCRGLTAVHARLRAPALLIWGTADILFPIERARAMLPEFAAGARLETIEGGRLYAHEEHPDTFVQFARPFLRERLHAKAGATAS
jgi:pimeloyl-ACP methyl ester carboxylesterase